jgi:acyl-CoA thioester hydrolase
VHPDQVAPRAGAHTSHVRVRYAETDQMGVVYHTHYLVWCEVGRTALLGSLGLPYSVLEADGLRLAVAEASIRYVRSARYDDVVAIVTRVARAQSRMVTFEYEIVGENPARGLLARAETRLVALDAAGEPRRLPEGLLEVVRKLSA